MDLKNRIFLVTGGTEGIGKAAVTALAKQGAVLVLVARNREKGENLVQELHASTGNSAIRLLVGDLSRQADVRAIAAAFRADYDHCDVLVNNAGAMFTDYALNEDGLERTFALNHLGHFLLTTLLMDRLAPGSRVVSTSSGAYAGGNIRLPDIATRSASRSAGFGAYADSKLANILFTRELARRLPGVAINCFHPGFVATRFGQNNTGTWSARFFGWIASVFGRRPEKGAETLLWLATSPETASMTGQYCHDCAVVKVGGQASDDALAAGLWELSEKLVAT